MVSDSCLSCLFLSSCTQVAGPGVTTFGSFARMDKQPLGLYSVPIDDNFGTQTFTWMICNGGCNVRLYRHMDVVLVMC